MMFHDITTVDHWGIFISHSCRRFMCCYNTFGHFTCSSCLVYLFHSKTKSNGLVCSFKEIIFTLQAVKKV